MMERVPWRKWLWQYVLPIVILQLSFGLTFLIGLGGGEPDVFWAVFIMPILALLMGVIFRPEWTLAVSVGFVFVLWVPIFFLPGATDPAVGVVGAFFVLLALVGLPMWLLVWLGKRIRPWLEGTFFSRHDKPGMPAG
jgi:hypothetical protein